MTINNSSPSIIFSTTNPLGHLVYLTENTLQEHIAGENGHHPERSQLLDTENLDRIKRVVNNPGYIFQDSTYENRFNYIDVIHLNGYDKLKNIKIVTETTADNSQQVVTIIPLGKVNEKVDGRIVYGRHT